MNWLSRIKHTIRSRNLSKRSPQEVFRTYYQSNKWGSSESRSGKGSSLAATENLRPILSALFRELEIKSILDVPCGDFHWMNHVQLLGANYLGGDIVPELIAENTRKYANASVRFEVIDLIEASLPKVDLVFVRDCLVHLSHAHVHRALRNIRNSGSKWLLTTTFPGTAVNSDIATGQWRKIDLTLAPFGLPPPENLIFEGMEEIKGQKPDKALGLWRIASLPDASSDSEAQ